MTPERRELVNHVGFEAADHDLILEQQIQFIGVLTPGNERDACCFTSS